MMCVEKSHLLVGRILCIYFVYTYTRKPPQQIPVSLTCQLLVSRKIKTWRVYAL